MMQRTLSVSQLVDYIAGTFAHDPILRQVCLRGEMSNFRQTSSGHAYFALKDQQSLIRCVCFRSQFEKIAFAPSDGMEVCVSGYVSLYAKDGQMQLTVQGMETQGAGALFARFEALKRELECLGYFAPERKRALPKNPRRIGIVTSATGAVIQDIQNVAWRRNPAQALLLCPVPVQGEGAAEKIAEAIHALNRANNAADGDAYLDVIIIARGGGSIEDLWPFNERVVADAIFRSEIPVVSAVGHETDFTIADFVADLRAPTPSAAAELCVPDSRLRQDELNQCYHRMYGALSMRLEKQREHCRSLRNSAAFLHPRMLMQNARQSQDFYGERLISLMGFGQKTRREKLTHWAARLDSASPFAVLRRGYALIQSQEGAIVSDSRQLHPGETVTMRFTKGSARATVTEITETIE